MSNLYLKTAVKSLGGLLLTLPVVASIETKPLVAQSITPANDNTGTIVTPNEQGFDIDGGSLSNDGKNLFHSFAEFGLDANQIANFLANPNIQNILSRINGGNPSIINGLIQVSGGNANLYLMNPAGIIFGKEASLNVAGDFSATTATAIGFEGGWFSAFGNNEYQNLVGDPNSFSFNTNSPGAIINAGDLAVAEGQNLSLVAGSIVNTGSLTASDGGVIISPVPGENLVRISIPGNLLSLEIVPPTDEAGNPIDITPKTLLELIKGSNKETGLTVNSANQIQAVDSEVEAVIPASSTSQVIAENIDEPSLFVFTPIDSPTDSPIVIAQDFSQTGVVESFDGLTFNIVPGEEAQISSDNQNLFYTFSRFDLPQSSQTANFIVPSTSSIKNILARVYNGNSSIIRGTIVVTSENSNSANLYLMNPAGIVFGSTAQLNVPGDFLATTANGIRLGEEWFSASGSNEYQNLVGDPNILAFQTAQASEESLNPIQRQPGAIINSADLTNSNGSIELIAGSIISTGDISTSGDRVRLATVPDDSILNLEDFSLASTNSVTTLPEAWNLAILDFQDLIDDSDFPDASNDLKLNNIASNQVQLSDSGVIVRNGDLAVNDISTNGGEIKLNSGGVKNLITGQIFSSTGNVTTSNLDSSSVAEQAGKITISATSNINTGNLDSSSVAEETEAGTAGNITLSAINNINTADIAANGSTSGNISFSVGQDQNITAGNISGILGNIDTSGEVTFGDITTPGTDINIGTQIPPESVSLSSVSTNGGNFSVSSSGNVNLTNSNGVVTNGGNITINANSLSGAANLDSSGASGGQIAVNANSSIETGTIDSSGSVGDGGTVTLDASGNIKVSSIDARGGVEGMGGNVNVSTDSSFQATSTLSESNISITSAGGIGGGEITIQHGGRGVRAFVVGDASVNGTAGVITNGNFSIAEGSFFTDTTEGQEGEQISLLSGSGGEQPQPEPEPEPQPTIDLLQQAADNSCNLSGDCQQSSTENAIAADSLPVATDLVTRERTREILTDIEAATGVKPAIIYVKFSPKSISVESALTQLEGSNTNDFQERLNPGKAELTVTLEPQDDDRLELLLVNTEGQLIKREVPGTSRKQVIELAEQLRQTVTNVRDAKSFLAPAQQLYQWLIAPLEQDLKAQKIENLVFIMDAGVRSLPVAALHDGHGFIVEKYSVGLMPSLSITDTRYVKVKDLQVLAMGADKFPDQPPLPSVPVELSLITQELWSGKSILNKGFTVDNLKEERALRPFGILHLATHGEFKPGELNNSYIQFGNTKVGLDKLRQLNLYDPPIELMVLSACRTAVGSEEAEIGFAGLAYQAGVKTALGSLWYVSDEGTLGLMTDFYEELKTAPIKAEALRQAQLAMLRGEVRVENGQLITSGGSFALPPELAWIGNKKLTHPYYWSAFTMIGNPW
jgi:filamentous hemagglutinin family protein